MAKKRLNNTIRHNIFAYLQSVMQPDGNILRKERQSYEKARDKISQALLDKFPHDDMKVLQRYKVASKDMCIKLATYEPSHQITIFHYNEGDKEIVPVIPNVNHTGFKPLDLGAVAGKAALKHHENLEELERNKRQIRKAYKELLYASRYFEDVTKILPELEKEYSRFFTDSNLPSTVSQSTIDCIRKDAQRRARNAST